MLQVCEAWSQEGPTMCGHVLGMYLVVTENVVCARNEFESSREII